MNLTVQLISTRNPQDSFSKPTVRMPEDEAARLAEIAKKKRQHFVSLLALTRKGRNTGIYTHANLEKKWMNMKQAEMNAIRAANAIPRLLPAEPVWRNAVENKLLVRTRRTRRVRRQRRQRRLRSA